MVIRTFEKRSKDDSGGGSLIVASQTHFRTKIAVTYTVPTLSTAFVGADTKRCHLGRY